MTNKNDPDGLRLPIQIDSASNGEYEPSPLTPMAVEANHRAFKWATENAKKRNLTRRSFMLAASGAATTLLAFNAAHAAHGKTGGYFDIPANAALDEAAASEILAKDYFIFDVHGHYVNPTGAWTKKIPSGSWYEFFKSPHLSAEHFIKDVFMDSETDMMVLTLIPSMSDAEPLTIEEASATREIVDRMDGNKRLLLHGRIAPNQPGDMERMPELVEKWGVSAWKCYSQWAPSEHGYMSPVSGSGFAFTDDIGIEFVENAIKSGVKNICVHKGLPFSRDDSYKYARCDDIGPIAKMYPDVNFLIYHSGIDPIHVEGAYNPRDSIGIDTLVASLEKAGLGPNKNVYADLGSTWHILRQNPNAAAHGIGKLLKHIGEDNVIWGTDAIWYGSPQDQILAFKAFQISEEYRDQYGYPELTDELRAKVFGLNAMKPYGLSAEDRMALMQNDGITTRKLAYAENPDPHFRTFGPKTKREFLNLQRWQKG